ncbi:MAG: DUF2141 domain-containing protein [Paludibacter sp.]
MKKLIVIISCIILFAVFNAPAQPQETKANLTFNLSGFADNSGQVLVQLFRKTDKVPTKPFKVIISQIANRNARVVIPEIEYGEYAAIIVHDQNANGHIDHSWGIPSEPLGYTNKWKLTVLSGMPTFEKLKFTFSESGNSQSVEMKVK